MKKTLLSWSSGKDSAWTLHILQQDPDVDVVGLFCTVNQKFDRVAMHAVRIELVQLQAKSAGLPIQIIPIPDSCSNSQYETVMGEFIEEKKDQGIECLAFGDLYLEDVRKYREKNLAGTGITPIFPLWGKDTLSLAKEMLDKGLRAKITCVDPKVLPPEFSGWEYDQSFLDQIPEQVDPCGENGEFHSFVFDGPMFKKPINICKGETVSREGFVFTDFLPAG